MYWTSIKIIGHSSKNLGLSQKTLLPSWYPSWLRAWCRVGLPARYSCWLALSKQSSLFTHSSCSWGPLWTQSSELRCGSENIIRADNKRFTKSGEYLHTKYLEGGPLNRGPKVSASLAFPHIAVYNPENDLIWEYETDGTRSASSDMHTFSPDVSM